MFVFVIKMFDTQEPEKGAFLLDGEVFTDFDAAAECVTGQLNDDAATGQLGRFLYSVVEGEVTV